MNSQFASFISALMSGDNVIDHRHMVYKPVLQTLYSEAPGIYKKAVGNLLQVKDTTVLYHDVSTSVDTLMRILNARGENIEKFAYYVWQSCMEDSVGMFNFVRNLSEDVGVWSSWRYGGKNGRLRDWAMEAIVSYADTGNAFGAFVKDYWSSEASTIAGKVYGTKGKAALLYGMLGSKFIKDYTVHAGDYASGWGSIIGSVHLPTFFDIPGMISIPVSPGGTLLPIDVPESITTSINGDFRMNLSEHHLYGSSRLGIKDYHSSQYQVVYSDTGSEIYSWQGLGGRKPWYSLVYAENISSLGTEPYGMAETNEYSVSHQLGMKQYELTNHLGNVQATVSDHRYTLYREEGNSWVVDRYHPVLSSAYDYYPFGMLMPDRYVSDTTSYCQTISQTKWMKKLTEICWTVSAPAGWPTIVTEGGGSTKVTISAVEIDIPAPTSTAEFSVMVTPAEENELLLTSGMVIGVGIVEVYEVIGGNEYILASTPIAQSQLPSQTKITFSPTSSEVKVKFKYGTSAWTWHGHSICITKPVMVSETYYVDVCDGGDDKYRFGFNGMEKDNEVKGVGNSLDFGARMYDSRVGRFLSLDPFMKQFPSESNYSFAGNSPIYFIDKDGEFKIHPDIQKNYPHVYKYLSSQLEKDVEKSSDIYRVFMLRTNATKEDIANDFKNNSGPEMISVPSPGGEYHGIVTDAVEFYNDKKDILEINEKVFGYVEGILSSKNSTHLDKQQALLLMNIVIFHCEAHRLDVKFGMNEKEATKSFAPYDAGNNVEKMLYGLPFTHQKENENKKDKIPGVNSKNDKLKEGVTEGIIKDAQGDERKESNLPTVPQ